MAIIDEIKQLTKSLYPTGRAFKMPLGSEFQLLHDGINPSLERAFNAAKSVLDSAIPDNDNFSADDASQWEIRLGLVSNPLVALSDRKLAIQRKMNHPGSIRARQHYLYLEGQLRAAGFDVYVFENRFPDGMGGYYTIPPTGVTGIEHGDIEHGDDVETGNPYTIVASSLDETVDQTFDFSATLKNTFFVCGPHVGDVASVISLRKIEFRQLILKIKPVQTIGFLFIDFFEPEYLLAPDSWTPVSGLFSSLSPISFIDYHNASTKVYRIPCDIQSGETVKLDWTVNVNNGSLGPQFYLVDSLGATVSNIIQHGNFTVPGSFHFANDILTATDKAKYLVIDVTSNSLSDYSIALNNIGDQLN